MEIRLDSSGFASTGVVSQIYVRGFNWNYKSTQEIIMATDGKSLLRDFRELILEEDGSEFLDNRTAYQ